MKFFVLLFLLGIAAAAPYYGDLDDAADEIVRDFLEMSPSFVEVLAADEDDDDVKTELGKKLREALEHILEKVKDAIDHGKTVKGDLLEKLKEIREKLKDIHIEVGDKAKALLEKIKERAKDFLRKLLDKLGLNKDKEERSLDETEAVFRSQTLKDMFRKIKDAILKKIDKEALKEKIEQMFKKGHEIADRLLELLKEKGDKGKQKLLDFIDRVLGDPEEKLEERSLQELWEKIKNYFKDFHIDLKEKYFKFGDWVKEVAGKALDKGKSKIENIKQIAKEFIDHAKETSKEVTSEALEFLRPYKDDLGSLWEQVKDTAKEVLKKKD